mgnify:CR=1 FL=1
MAELKITSLNFENEVVNADKPVGYRPKAEIAAMVEGAR